MDDLDNLPFLFIGNLNRSCPAGCFYPPNERHAFNCSSSLTPPSVPKYQVSRLKTLKFAVDDKLRNPWIFHLID